MVIKTDTVPFRRLLAQFVLVITACLVVSSLPRMATSQEEPAAKAANAPAPDAGATAAKPQGSRNLLSWLIHVSGLIGLVIFLLSFFF